MLVLLPGPDSLLVLGNSLFEGRRAGWVTAGGCFAGNIVHAGLAAAGVSALVAASPALFDALRLAGAGYLAWIGVRSLRSAWLTWRTGEGVAVPAGQGGGGRRSFFARALVTNLLNAKVILFYLAFVPQFVTPALGSVWLQTLVLGLVLAVMGCLYHLALAGLAAGAARRVAGNARFRAALDGVAGLLFLGFAARLLLAERRLA